MPDYGGTDYGVDSYGTPGPLPAPAPAPASTGVAYGAGAYGAGAYGGGAATPQDPALLDVTTRVPARVRRATWHLWPKLLAADVEDALYGEALPISTGAVHMASDAAVKYTLTAGLLADQGLEHPIAWFVPTLQVDRPDPTDPTRIETLSERLGLYAVLSPTEAVARAGRTIAIQGNDLRWLLGQAQFPSVFTVPKGANVVRAAADVVRSAGIRRVNFPPHAATMDATRSWPLNTTKLQIATDLLSTIGYYAPWADRAGWFRSMPYRLLATAQPSRAISSAAGDVLSDITITPTPGEVYNQVIVVGTDLKQAPIVVTATNTDPGSPTSVWNIAGTGSGDPVYVVKYVEDRNLTTFEAAEATAKTYLDQASANYQTIEFGVTPDPRFDVHDVWELDVVQDDGGFVASGKWWLREVTLGLTAQDPVQTVKLSRVQTVAMETS